MSFILRVGSAFAVLIGSAAIFQWDSAYHLLIGGAILTLAGGIVLAWQFTRSRRHKSLRERTQALAAQRFGAPWFHNVAIGGSWGALSTIILCAGFWVAARLPIQDKYYDFDREHTEAVMNAMETSRAWQAAANYGLKRTRRRMSATWKQSMRERIVRDLVEAGHDQSDAELRVQYWKQAVALANEFQVDRALPSSLLQAHHLRLAGDSDRRQWSAAEQKLVGRLADRRRERHFERADELLQLAAELMPQRTQEFESARLENLLQQAEATSVPTLRFARFKDAASLAQSLGKLTAELQQRVDQAAQQLEATLPMRLKPGNRVETLRQTAEFQPPVVMLEIAVTDAQNRPVSQLSAKDFQMEVNRQSVQGWVSSLETNRGRLSIALLLDHSGSTQGTPARAARDGIKRFAEALPAHSSLRVMGFAETPSWLTDWDATPESLNRKLAILPSHGGTALFVALETALRELATKPQPRAVVLFTDGKDSKLSATLIDEAVQRMGTYQSPVHIVALRTKDFDEVVLRRVASATEGSLVTVESLDQLQPHFVRLGAALRTSGYRLVIPVDGAEQSEVKVTIGRDHPLQLRATIDAPRARSAGYPSASKEKGRP